MTKFGLFTVTALSAAALALTGCARSLPHAPSWPAPPAAGLEVCTLPDIPVGAISEEDAALLILRHMQDLAACEARRRALVDAWPR